MKLLVIINNGPAVFDLLQNTGIAASTDRRFIEIDLTDDQVAKLQKDDKEIIESITLQKTC